ncbi:MAG: hypothetical protein R2873_11900 [Caldilineaceae bacterium]
MSPFWLSRIRVAVLAVLVVLITGGCGMHLFDKREVPVVTVSSGLRPTVSWTPANAYEVTFYEGAENKDGFDVLWNARMGGGFVNDLQSPIVFGVPPTGSEVRDAPPLEAGKTYTVVVFRTDPKGSGDGFFNTRHRYETVVTFTAEE